MTNHPYPESGDITHPNPKDCAFDLESTLKAVVSVHTHVPSDASTAQTLGMERQGHGVIIREDGLILTIGYLITEAEEIWILDGNGDAAPAHVVGYDNETGFGLIQALHELNVTPVELGDSAALMEGDRVIVAGHGGIRHSITARVIAKREFTGYWEYLLDEGIFTAPAHPNWGGTAVFDRFGYLVGIGSLFIQHGAPDEKPIDGNLVVPIDLLKPIFDDLVKFGCVNKPARPWLGLLAAEEDHSLVVVGVVEDGPAGKAEIQVGDVVLRVGGAPVKSLAELFRKIWAQGSAGVSVPLTLQRDDNVMEIAVASIDRRQHLKTPRLH